VLFSHRLKSSNVRVPSGRRVELRCRWCRARTLESTVNLLRQKSVAAVETLTDVANDKEASASARVSAARSVVELAIKSAELQDLEERIGEMGQLAMDKP
jgi:hypothetical protein